MVDALRASIVRCTGRGVGPQWPGFRILRLELSKKDTSTGTSRYVLPQHRALRWHSASDRTPIPECDLCPIDWRSGKPGTWKPPQRWTFPLTMTDFHRPPDNSPPQRRDTIPTRNPRQRLLCGGFRHVPGRKTHRPRRPPTRASQRARHRPHGTGATGPTALEKTSTRIDRRTVQAVPQRRGRSITARIRAMVMIPTTALVVLWLILTATLAVDAVYKSLLARATDDLVTPAAVGLVDAMNERSATIAHIENPDDPELVQKLAEARESTDDSLGTVVDELIGFADLAPGDGGMHIEMLHEMYQDIDAVRESVDSEELGRTEIFDYYNELILHGADSFDTQGREGNEGDAVSPGFTA